MAFGEEGLDKTRLRSPGLYSAVLWFVCLSYPSHSPEPPESLLGDMGGVLALITAEEVTYQFLLTVYKVKTVHHGPIPKETVVTSILSVSSITYCIIMLNQ